MTILVLTLSLSGVLPSEASNHRRWSVDLHEYGYYRKEAGVRYSYPSETRVAATKEVIVVAIGNMAPAVQVDERHNMKKSLIELSLLFFDASNGKLRAKRGPWSSDSSFELSPTSRGNFLLHLRHHHGSNAEHGESLCLLSPSGEEIKRRDLAPITNDQKSGSYYVLHSPSRGTSLLKWFDGDVFHYQVFDANTLETQVEWTESKGSPSVIALSDKELLGFRQPRESDERTSTKRKMELFVRTLDGAWRSLPVNLEVSHSGAGFGMDRGDIFAPDHTMFLSGHLLAGLVSGEESGPVLKVVQTDGTIVFSGKIEDAGAMAVVPDGRYFGLVYASQSAFDRWLGGWIDMQVWPYMAYLSVWRVSNPAQAAKLSLGRNVGDYCFSSDGSQFAYVDGGSLKVIPMPIAPDTNIPHTY